MTCKIWIRRYNACCCTWWATFCYPRKYAAKKSYSSFFHEPRPLILMASSRKVTYVWIETRFAALELHSATPIIWIIAGLTHLDFINPGQWVIQVSSSDLVITLTALHACNIHISWRYTVDGVVSGWGCQNLKTKHMFDSLLFIQIKRCDAWCKAKKKWPQHIMKLWIIIQFMNIFI